jgi:hypothetical protein
MKKGTSTLFVVLIAALGLLVVGCSGGDDNKGPDAIKGPAPTPGVTQPGAKTPEQQAAAVGKPAGGDNGADPGTDK